MYKKSNKLIIYIVYDGIGHPGFAREVLRPLLVQLEESKNLEITLITFEKKAPSPQAIMAAIPAHERFHFIMGKRLPFLGMFSMRPALWQLNRMLAQIPCHQIVAHGPHAGHLAMAAIEHMAKQRPELMRRDHPASLPNLTVQARGLCAEEFKFMDHSQKRTPIKNLIAQFLYKEHRQVEFEVYRNKRKTDIPHDVHIEAISPALKEHLIENFRADPTKITLAYRDIPRAPTLQQVRAWKKEMRTKLLIPTDAHVFTYIGSSRPSECAPETIFFFLEQHRKNPKSFLLLLTSESAYFTSLLSQSQVPVSAYLIRNVQPGEIYQYLAIADRGLLFAHRKVTSWVSRPHAMLEYQALRVPIIHNETIAWLAQQ